MDVTFLTYFLSQSIKNQHLKRLLKVMTHSLQKDGWMKTVLLKILALY